jgi:YARHG domain
MEQRHLGAGDNVGGDKTVNNMFSIGRKGVIILSTLSILVLSGSLYYYIKHIKEPNAHIIGFQLDSSFFDECAYPYVIPNSVIDGESKETMITLKRRLNDEKGIHLTKAPYMQDNTENGGNKPDILPIFAVPFHIVSNSIKKTVVIQNKFKLKIKVEPPVDFANINSTCAGDGLFIESKEVVVLSSKNKEYTKDVTFPNAQFYTGSPNELNSFSIPFDIQDPGVYHIEIEIPYTFNGKTEKAMFKVVDFSVPLKCHNWTSADEFEDDKVKNFRLNRSNVSCVWKNGGYMVENNGVKNSTITTIPTTQTTVNEPVTFGKYTFASSKRLTEGDLKNYDKTTLKIIRNEIFARYGCIFETEEMKNYFTKQSWYTPRVDKINVMNQLSEQEKRNIELIKTMESRL